MPKAFTTKALMTDKAPMTPNAMTGNPRLFVVLPTSGASQMLPRTLASLAECRLPDSYAGTFVVENGARGRAEEVTRGVPSQLDVKHIYVERANKSNALNQVFQQLNDDDLVFLTDDDIRFAPGLLDVYAEAAKNKNRGYVFGGPLRIDSEAQPPLHWRDFLPGSLTGWEPNQHEFNAMRDCFLGANWAVFVGDVRRAGGFDPRFGPGSPMNATGQEWNMQRALRKLGTQFTYLPEAAVWHHVEYDRYNEDFLYRRKYRGGIEAGIVWADRMNTPRLRDRILHPYMSAKVRYYAYSLCAKAASCVGNQTAHLRYKMESEHARGMTFSYPRARGEQGSVQ